MGRAVCGVQCAVGGERWVVRLSAYSLQPTRRAHAADKNAPLHLNSWDVNKHTHIHKYTQEAMEIELLLRFWYEI